MLAKERNHCIGKPDCVSTNRCLSCRSDVENKLAVFSHICSADLRV